MRIAPDPLRASRSVTPCDLEDNTDESPTTVAHLSPRGALSELRHTAQWLLRLLYYADARGGPAHLRIVPTAGEIVPASP